MKTLILVRHAKSDWPENTDDFNRPLAEKGVADAKKMGRFLKQHDLSIGKFYTSPALRAFSTCEIFNKEFHIEMETLQKLYNASESIFESLVVDLPDNLQSVALFSHNNGISNFANSMSEEVFMLPTCGVAGFQIDTDVWSEFHGVPKKLLFFYEPKKLNAQ